MQSIRTGKELFTEFLQHAYKMAEEEGHKHCAVVPDEIWDRAGSTWKWEKAEEEKMIFDRPLKIETERLRIVPMTFNFVSKVLNGDLTAYTELQINPAEEWPNEDTREIMPIIQAKLRARPEPDGFGAWLFIDTADRIIVGDGGFKGAPDHNGKIDLGYGIIESKRRRGYAFEAAAALIQWGFSQNNVKTITADCLKSNIPSMNLLLKAGMSEIGRDDTLIYFELNSAGR